MQLHEFIIHHKGRVLEDWGFWLGRCWKTRVCSSWISLLCLCPSVWCRISNSCCMTPILQAIQKRHNSTHREEGVFLFCVEYWWRFATYLFFDTQGVVQISCSATIDIQDFSFWIESHAIAFRAHGLAHARLMMAFQRIPSPITVEIASLYPTAVILGIWTTPCWASWSSLYLWRM